MTDSRPLSPHLQVYRWQLPMLLSIVHRATGIFLSIGAVVLVYWLAAIAAGPAAYTQAQTVLGSVIGQIALIAWAFSLFFHLCNGVRHLFWDVGLGFELPATYRSGYIVVICAVILTAATWFGALQGAAP